VWQNFDSGSVWQNFGLWNFIAIVLWLPGRGGLYIKGFISEPGQLDTVEDLSRGLDQGGSHERIYCSAWAEEVTSEDLFQGLCQGVLHQRIYSYYIRL
jgi:hypothetical protein